MDQQPFAQLKAAGGSYLLKIYHLLEIYSLLYPYPTPLYRLTMIKILNCVCTMTLVLKSHAPWISFTNFRRLMSPRIAWQMRVKSC